MQPIYIAEDGVIRFRENRIVRRLVNERLIDLNAIATWRDIPVEDREQFWQMLGYSTSGYGDLSFVRPEVVQEADERANDLIMEANRQREAAEALLAASPPEPPVEPVSAPSAWERLGEEDL